MITDAERNELVEIIKITTQFSTCLNEWENKFISDIDEKFQKYLLKLYLSEKQWNVLQKIKNKCKEESEYLIRDQKNKSLKKNDDDITF